MDYATYSANDDKLRLYPAKRLDDETFAKVKGAGFKWAPKQGLFVAPNWTPAREDLLLELVDEIEDEDYSAEERAADRAERFAGYRDKRMSEAIGHADRFDAGPAAFGHQNLQRAERQAARHDRFRTHAVSQWSKAEYWQSRTQAVIEHALHRSSPEVRRSRILRLEAEQRKFLKSAEQAKKSWERWSKIRDLDGGDCPLSFRTNERGYRDADLKNSTPAGVAVFHLANAGWSGDYTHPRTGHVSSLYSHLTNEADPITPNEAVELWFAGRINPSDPGSHVSRWTRHYELRLTYERAMLAAEGGAASEVEMEVGGWLGSYQIQAVHKSPVTGRVVSVSVFGEKPYYRGNPVKRADGSMGAPIVLRKVNIERLGESVYRAPTGAEREQFVVKTKERKAQEKATKPAAPPLLNLTDEDAQKLQDAWNAKVRERYEQSKRPNPPVATVWPMTQAEYSERSKGGCGPCEAVSVTEQLKPLETYSQGLSQPVFKVRVGSSGMLNGARRVVVLTDKPRKPIPWDAIEAAKAEMPTAESLYPLLHEIALAFDWRNRNDATRDLLAKAHYVGWVYVSSSTQAEWTEAGAAMRAKFIEEERAKTINVKTLEPALV